MKSVSMLSVLMLGFAGPVPAGAPLSCHVYAVSDGDTLKARCGEGDEIKVRLAEIDAPESGQPFGKVAKRQLSDLVYGRDVSLEVVDIDRYGRRVAIVSVGDVNINREMLLLGMGWCYTRYAKHSWCAESEREAKAAGIGLWSGPSPVPPWEYRRQRKKS